MFTFYLVRHGETEHNKLQIAMGQHNSSLSSKGRQDAQIIGELLRNITFTAIFTSDLGRAIETARIVRKNLNEKCKTESRKELREINYGIYNNTPKATFETRCKAYKNKDVAFVFPDGESLLDVKKRAGEFIISLEEKYENQIILIVTHSGTIRGIVSYFTERYLEKVSRRELNHKYVGKFEISNGKLKKYE